MHFLWISLKDHLASFGHSAFGLCKLKEFFLSIRHWLFVLVLVIFLQMRTSNGYFYFVCWDILDRVGSASKAPGVGLESTSFRRGFCTSTFNLQGKSMIKGGDGI
jgi:hypothetical protein